LDKRYQVFVSSTFWDLKEERQAALRAVLELEHMPAGMELFAAGDDSAWELIKDVIDASDYYILIIGGRYGSLDEAGIGFTEKEYDYAREKKKPVIPLLHRNPGDIPRDKTETDGKAWKKLQAFRAKVEKPHTCVYWSNANELKSNVITSLMTTIRRHPAVGWCKANVVPPDTAAELLALRKRVQELEKQLETTSAKGPEGTEELAQGDDMFDLRVASKVTDRAASKYDEVFEQKVALTWNEIFAEVAPCMITEASDAFLRARFKDVFYSALLQQYEGSEGRDVKISRRAFACDESAIETCIVQFRALGLIVESTAKRSIKDTGTYWTLTPYGNSVMVRLRAIRRPDSPAEGTS
jgi:Domain of unknown function (DUF4062)